MERFRVPVISILMVAILVGGIIFFLKQNTTSYPIEITLPSPSQMIEVQVSGEVQDPGLYTLQEGDRVADAIEAAGGFTSDAERSVVNQARNLRDGAKVHIPEQGESSQHININMADVWLLDALPGIGPALAERIIDYRYQNGPFQCMEDLKKVKGIGDSTFEKLKDKITVR